MVRESKFQHELILELQGIFPGIMILKNDPSRITGVPDLLLLYENKWAALEVKREEKASKQPNQDYYVELMDNMSYASFVYPENKEVVLSDLQRTFKP